MPRCSNGKRRSSRHEPRSAKYHDAAGLSGICAGVAAFNLEFKCSSRVPRISPDLQPPTHASMTPAAATLCRSKLPCISTRPSWPTSPSLSSIGLGVHPLPLRVLSGRIRLRRLVLAVGLVLMASSAQAATLHVVGGQLMGASGIGILTGLFSSADP